jgi:hypothetical protein
MGVLAQQTIQRLEASNELRVNAGVISMDDTRVKMIENLISRSELEMKGLDGVEISNEAIMGKTIDAKVSMDEADKQVSMDDLSRFTDRQLEDFDRTIREVEYGDIDLLRHLQNTTIPRGATQHTFPLTDLQGKYKRITGSAKDLPTSHISGQEHTIKVEMGGGSLEWNIQEMDAANFANIPYEAEKARAVRRAYLQDIYDITIRGNDNLEGLMTTDIDSAAVADSVDNPNTVAGAALKYWINKTGREIVEDLADARIAIHTGTEGRWGGPFIDDGLEGNRSSFTCLLPLAAMNALYKVYMNTSAGGSSPQTTWAYLNSPQGRAATGITNYKVALDFDSAFQSDTAAGFMLLPNDPNAYSFVKAAELTPLPVQFQGLSMIIPYYDYFAGLKLIRNKALVRRYSIQAP